MRLIQRMVWTAAASGLFLALPGPSADLQGQQRGAGAGDGRGRAGGGAARGQMEVLVPMPVKPHPFVPPNKALTKLSDLLAKHKGQQNWKEVIVHDNLFHAEYI